MENSEDILKRIEASRQRIQAGLRQMDNQLLMMNLQLGVISSLRAESNLVTDHSIKKAA